MSARDAARGFRSLDEAVPGYTTAAEYYEGTVPEAFASRVLQRTIGKQGARYKVNLAKTPVTAVAERLEIMSVTVPDDATATARLAEIWQSNALLFEAPNVHLRASEFGDAYVLVWEGEDDGDDPVINYLPPSECRVIYDRDNPRKKLFAIHAWRVRKAGETGQETEDQATYRCDLLYPDRIEKWVTKAGQRPSDPAGWEQYAEPKVDDDGEETGDFEEWPLPNPYDEVPVFHFRNATPYGVPEHYHGYGAQDAINKIVVTHLSSVDFHGAPQRYALETPDAGGDDDLDLDDDFTVDEDGQSAPDSSQPGLKSGPGQVWWLTNVEEVGQFEAADPDAFLKPAAFYIKLLGQTTTTPMHLLDESGDEPSGESRRRKEAPLTKKVKDRSQRYASTWSELLSFALKIAGLDDRRVDVRYAPAEVVSDAEGWATVKSKIEAGVPVRQALSEAGYTSDQIEEWFPEGEENNLRVADLVAVADVLQKLGSAVALGIISEAEARAMLPEGIVAATATDG